MSNSLRSNKSFQAKVRDFYRENKRDLIWREYINPYWVVVSEIMLQQTQVSRVAEKFPHFLEVFPDFKSLASAPLEKVLREWQGMGYNRRGKYLREIAKIIVEKYDSIVPRDPGVLEEFPGIGPATARSIVVYSYNIAEPFIETNVRRVYIHHFFSDKKEVSDRDIMPLVRETLDKKNPRDWFYALMDYGTYLGRTVPNPNWKSKHYSKQSKFEGSNRQVRGAVLRYLLNEGSAERELLEKRLGFEKARLYNVLKQLTSEGIIAEKNGEYKVTT
ncbi:A/G-specific adenine glycosylase [Candidatus Roizmanbacteria bacterium]|nr:MAG: A/G-specific adenine glycosylase [Candidatus Roizmanbacteria bacterium]